MRNEAQGTHPAVAHFVTIDPAHIDSNANEEVSIPDGAMLLNVAGRQYYWDADALLEVASISLNHADMFCELLSIDKNNQNYFMLTITEFNSKQFSFDEFAECANDSRNGTLTSLLFADSAPAIDAMLALARDTLALCGSFAP